MRLVQIFREIFYFPFYFVSLNVAGFLSFMRFIRGTQPPMWRKGERLCLPFQNSEKNHREYLENEVGCEDKVLEYPRRSIGGR